MNISPVGQKITERFFHAVEVLRQTGAVRGLGTVTSRCGANYWNVCTVRKEPATRVLKPELLACLVSEFGISARWLLTGEGDIFETRYEHKVQLPFLSGKGAGKG